MTAEGGKALQDAGVADYLKLVVIVTSPAARGQGLASALLAALTSLAEQQRLPLCLEAAHDGLLPLYERHGFATLTRLNVQPDGSKETHYISLMLRLPAAQANSTADGAFRTCCSDNS
ncbi:hypothetical protein OEZ85_000418 [Tetradesmus obliquus]|uniref:N-acetyltransferase domain-containing protein n=1 Tax=Tetradesmus obliquus TaxID=3088 RepID=A0ABY8UQ96_TETOB|nr:hypothetical protein OEZ85_000418 [Tetradesmus obliquus]